MHSGRKGSAPSRERRQSQQKLALQAKRVQAEFDQLRAMIAGFEPKLGPEEGSAEWIRAILRARRRREEIIGASLFSDPAWDILLEIYGRHLENERATVGELCKAAPNPETTVWRWLGELERAGIIVRTPDEHHGKRVWIELSRRGLAALDQYFSGSQSSGVAI